MSRKSAPKSPLKARPTRPARPGAGTTESEAQPSTPEAPDPADSADLQQVAYRLAGQAVMADRLGIPMERVVVGRDPENGVIGELLPAKPRSHPIFTYETERDAAPSAPSPGDHQGFGMVQPALNACPDARDASEAKILILLADVVAAIQFHRPEALYRELESRVYRSLGFDPLMIECGPFLSSPLLDRIQAEAALLTGTEVERVKFLDWMIARAINILTLPAHRRAVPAALLNHHELMGAEVGEITLAANTAS